MFEGLSESLATTIQTNPWMAPLAALLGGLLTAANPCVLAMVPLMVGYVGGQESRGAGRSLLLSLTFSSGLTSMFAALFLMTWAASSFLRASWWTYVAAGVCLLMGLHLLGLLHFKLPAPSNIQPKRRGYVGAFLLGLLFGLVSMPCAGPVLLALLAVVPLKGAAYGGVLLVAYSFGHCGLVLVGGTSMGFVQGVANSRGWQRGLTWTRKIAGLLIALVGLFLLLA